MIKKPPPEYAAAFIARLLYFTFLLMRQPEEVFFKCENLQRAGAFKIRGATNKIRSLTEEERKRGVPRSRRAIMRRQ